MENSGNSHDSPAKSAQSASFAPDRGHSADEFTLAHTLNGIPLLRDVSPAALRTIEQKCRVTTYEPDETIVDRDDSTLDVFFILSGSARVMNLMAEGREISLADLRAGDHFGELSAIDCRERTARIISTGKTTIAALPREDFVALLLEHPRVVLELLERFAEIIRSANRHVHTLSTLTAHQRIFKELLRLIEPNSNGDGSWLIELVPNHQEIASWADTNKQEVAVAIGALVRDGILERRNRSFLIRDRNRLRDLAGE